MVPVIMSETCHSERSEESYYQRSQHSDDCRCHTVPIAGSFAIKAQDDVQGGRRDDVAGGRRDDEAGRRRDDEVGGQPQDPSASPQDDVGLSL
jgi:hypothetical protein